MRNGLFAIGGVIVATIVASAQAAHAQQPPLYGGVVGQSLGGSCNVNRGLATFQRNTSLAPYGGEVAVASFEELFAGLSGNVGYDLRGQAVLTFTSSTAGSIRFKSLPSVLAEYKNPTFSNYTETVSATSPQLVVAFTIAFPGCSLPVSLNLDLGD